MAGGGVGSQLILRAKEARMRAQAAQSMGLSGGPSLFSPPSGAGLDNPLQGPVAPGQPPQHATVDVSPRDRMYAEAESFLAGLQSAGSTPRPGPTQPGA